MRSFLLVLLFLLIGCNSSNDTSDKTSSYILPTPIEYNISRYKPTPNTSWQWQLTGALNSSYDVDLYDIDLFDTPKETIESLHQEGKRVICYFSAGSFEDWREDRDNFPNEVLGNPLDNWEGERWLDIRSNQLKEIIKNRLDLAKAKGCDGVEPDNIDGYSNNSGFDLTAQDQLEYNIFIADEAHKRGLSVGLKNDFAQAKILEPFFDFSLAEECFINNECKYLTSFINSNKPVFDVEYSQKYVTNTLERAKMCQESNKLGFQTLVLPVDLDDTFRYSCQ